MRVGYARVSTADQPIEAQLARLADCDKVFNEKLSGANQARGQLLACLEYVREGDTLVVTRLDRLARSVSHLCHIAEQLERKNVALVVLDQAIDTTTPTGRFLFHMLAAVAEFELSIRKEAQRAGIAHARAAGKATGRAPRLNTHEQVQVALDFAHGMRAEALARRWRISKKTVYRYVATWSDSVPTLGNQEISLYYGPRSTAEP